MSTEPPPPPPDNEAEEDQASAALVSGVPEFTELPGAEVAIDQFDVGKKKAKATDWDASKHAALTQALLARRLIWLLAGVLAGGAGLISTVKWSGLKAQDVIAFFGVAFGAVITLTTAATSFWFGSQRERARSTGSNNPDSN